MKTNTEEPVDRNGEPLAAGDVVKTELGDTATIERFERTLHGLAAVVTVHDKPGTPAHRSAFMHIAKQLQKTSTKMEIDPVELALRDFAARDSGVASDAVRYLLGKIDALRVECEEWRAEARRLDGECDAAKAEVLSVLLGSKGRGWRERLNVKQLRAIQAIVQGDQKP